MKEYHLDTLDNVQLKKRCTVAYIDKNNNTNINRMYDLGIIKDTQIIPLHKSMFGDTVAYLIKGSVIALRKSDAQKIKVIV